MDRLDCTVMPYAWGSRTAIAALMGRAPSDTPEAELWMGAHPIAPSRIARDGAKVALDEAIARAPERELGPRVVRELGPRLPFLLKVLAAAEPLSLQAHPTLAQAAKGFADEERRGIPRDAPNRNYKDELHKPELLCALTPFTALSGFRTPAASLALFGALGVDAPAFDPLRAGDVRGAFERVMAAPRELVDRTVAAAGHDGAFPRERALVRRLAELYPGDVGIVSALLLELLELRPGEAIYLDAGNLHAYVEGTGVEIMASSDNVLRGGLTKKHVDLPELLSVLDFYAPPVAVRRPRAVDAAEAVYDTPAREFRLSRVAVDGRVVRTGDGPEILLVTEGSVTAGGVALARGESMFVPAHVGRYELDGRGTVFRATTNLDQVA